MLLCIFNARQLRVLKKRDPNRKMYLAVERNIFETFFEEEAGLLLLEEPGFHLLVFDAKIEEIIQWKPQINL
ncbi:element excision factor XisH family protein [Mastigocoleus testarum]|uniref:element excision factor XisH family protein n=1 Tax=Mastigocoleus testarum TaxID=996925 RepID=UPI0038995348